MRRDMKALNMTQEELEVDEMAGQAAAAEDELTMEAGPQGTFSKGAVNAFIQALNTSLELFDQDPYPPVSDEDVAEGFPVELTNAVLMVSNAISDAVKQQEIPEELVFDISAVTDDRELRMLAGKLVSAARNPAFKKFLSQSDDGTIEDEPVVEDSTAGGPTESEMDAFFQSRM